jgi:hypothetical protein
MQSSIALKTRICCGQKFQRHSKAFNGTEYVFVTEYVLTAFVTKGKVLMALVNTATGEIFSNPISVVNQYDVTQGEFNLIKNYDKTILPVF